MTKTLNLDHLGVQYQIPEYLKGGRYRIESVLARGGMGIIYRARDTHLYNKKVLVKSLIYKPSIFQHANDLARDQEIKAKREQMRCEKVALEYAWERNLGSVPVLLDYFEDLNPMLHGPHCDVDTGLMYTCDVARLDPFLVINFFNGEPLSSLSRKQVASGIRITIAKKVLLSIGKIFDCLHQKYGMTTKAGKDIELQCIYCDLKPANIINTYDKSLVLIDFGSIVKNINGVLQDRVTATAGYCAPEINEETNSAVTASDVSPLVDVYSLGATLYEILTGQAPVYYRGQNQFDLNQVNSISPDWSAFLATALNEASSDRFASMKDMIQAYYTYVEKQTSNNANQKTAPVSLQRWLPEVKSNPFLAGHQWREVKNSESFSAGFHIILVQKESGSFYLNAQVMQVGNQSSFITVALSNVEKKLAAGLLHRQLEDLATILCLNRTYLPELLETHLDNDPPLFIVKAPTGKEINLDIYNPKYLMKRISRIIDVLGDMYCNGIILSELSVSDIIFDQTDAPIFQILTHLHSYREKESDFNAVLLNFIQPCFSAPEIVQDGKFYEQTYSYLAGRLLFHILCSKIKTDPPNTFLEKKELENWVGYITKVPEFRTFLLHSLPLDPRMRSTLNELKSILASRSNGAVR